VEKQLKRSCGMENEAVRMKDDVEARVEVKW